MANPPRTPPSSDVGGIHRDRVSRTDPRVGDKRAQDQLAAETRESVGRPDQDVPPRADEGTRAARRSSERRPRNDME